MNSFIFYLKNNARFQRQLKDGNPVPILFPLFEPRSVSLPSRAPRSHHQVLPSPTMAAATVDKRWTRQELFAGTTSARCIIVRRLRDQASEEETSLSLSLSLLDFESTRTVSRHPVNSARSALRSGHHLQPPRGGVKTRAGRSPPRPLALSKKVNTRHPWDADHAFSLLSFGPASRPDAICDTTATPARHSRAGKKLFPRRQRPRLRALASPPASHRLRVRGRRATVSNARRAIDDPAARALLAPIGERDSATPERCSREGPKRSRAVRRQRSTRVTERR
ncbi:unnamed protein product [Ectocarpus sp. 13 AM-2016]